MRSILLSTTTQYKSQFLRIMDPGERTLMLRDIPPDELAKHIGEVDSMLAAELLADIGETTRQAVAAMLSQKRKYYALQVLQAWQNSTELGCTVNDEFVPDHYVVTGELPQNFPLWMRKCSKCGGEYQELDGILHGACESHSFHERCDIRGRSCAVTECPEYRLVCEFG